MRINEITDKNLFKIQLQGLNINFENECSELEETLKLFIDQNSPSRNLILQGNIQNFYDQTDLFETSDYESDSDIENLKSQLPEFRKRIDDLNQQLSLPPGKIRSVPSKNQSA